jgi:hypothetical protein
MHRRIPLLLVGLLLTGRGAALSQVVAHQGVAPAPETVSFQSPMILELTFPNVSSLDPGSQTKLPAVGNYVCDNDVRLQNLTVAKEYKGPRKARSLELVIAGGVLVADSYDRRADVALRLKSGDTILATQTLRNLKAEERRYSPFRILMPVDESSLTAAYAAATAPVLEVTLTVRDDS